MQKIMEILVVIFLELIEGSFSVSLSDHSRYNASIPESSTFIVERHLLALVLGTDVKRRAPCAPNQCG